ncbi:MAG: phosphoribosylformylglycinamidine cyclo-ligase, partial [Desulfovibrio sp.]|nr:phosphoribosylformylglycinamidine cyclo-ligase [Desulfovibrio sp.]
MAGNRADAYKAAGVDIEAGNSLVKKFKALAESTKTRGVVSEVGGFGGLFRPDVSGMREPTLVAATDGVGTKLKLAFQFGRHSGV